MPTPEYKLEQNIIEKADPGWELKLAGGLQDEGSNPSSLSISRAILLKCSFFLL